MNKSSRRRVLTGTAATLLAAIAVAGAATRAAPAEAVGDAELIRLHAAALAQAKVIAVIEKEVVPAAITTESQDKERRLNDADNAWDAIMSQIAQTSAHSIVGFHIKAAAMLVLLKRYVCCRLGTTLDDIADGIVGYPEDAMALSLARDMLEWRAGA